MTAFRFRSIRHLGLFSYSDNPLAQMLPHFRTQDHEMMLAGPAKLRLLLIAVRIANEVDIAARRAIIDIDIATLTGNGTQATPTTVQTGRVLDTIAFSKGIL